MINRTAAHARSVSLPVVRSHVMNAMSDENDEHNTSLRPSNNVIQIQGVFGHSPLQNQLLAALPEEDYERLLPQLELVSMPAGGAICETDGSMRHVYFPTSSIVSMLHDTKEGTSTETAVIGNEGLVGFMLCMSGSKTITRMVVKCAGYGFRMSAQALKTEFNLGGALQQYLLRYTQALLTQMSQTAVCNRHHDIGQQLCRCLLVTLDRSPCPELNMTQEMIANMLGVRRESITEAAVKLQDDRIIQYKRGHITVIDRLGLEAHACECYTDIKEEYERLLPSTAEA